MKNYIFQGRVLPERALLDFCYPPCEFVGLDTKYDGKATISILKNQILVWVESDYDWNILDLRNVVKNLLASRLNALGFILGYAYDVELTRCTCRELEEDQVFGIDFPCLANRHSENIRQENFHKLLRLMSGNNGIFISRCLQDLNSALKSAEDTGFYCYRAIESLRHHFNAVNNVADTTPKRCQWEKFRSTLSTPDNNQVIEQKMKAIAESAKKLRHGEPQNINDQERQEILTQTWDIVEGYLFVFSHPTDT